MKFEKRIKKIRIDDEETGAVFCNQIKFKAHCFFLFQMKHNIIEL